MRMKTSSTEYNLLYKTVMCITKHRILSENEKDFPNLNIVSVPEIPNSQITDRLQ